MSADLPALTDALLSAAKSAGADAADAIAVTAQSVSVDVLEGALESAESAEATEIGLRVLVGLRQATVASSDLTQATMAEMAERAVAMARLAPEDPHLGLADASQLSAKRDAVGLDLTDEAKLDPAELEEQALATETAAAAVPGVAKVQSASAGQTRRDIFLAASNGFSGGYARTSHGRSAVAISGEGLGMERDYNGESRAHLADLPGAEEIGRIAGERAAARAGARKPPTGAYPVLYDERIASSLVGHLIAAINGASVARGASWLRDAMGEMVLPKGVGLTEDPHRPRISSARYFDAEGLATHQRALVEDGVLSGWLLDLATARKLAIAPTGNATRGVGGPPSPAPASLALTQGSQSPAEIMADMGEGLLVTSLIGASINPTTGDYSRGASGFWIKGGQIAYPVNECTIAGNLRAMLGTIRPANDARPHLSNVVPSILVEGLTIAGA
ncbi:MAG: metallopeptidase TldD-related protein [Pseudomonadota bacterium]